MGNRLTFRVSLGLFQLLDLTLLGSTNHRLGMSTVYTTSNLRFVFLDLKIYKEFNSFLLRLFYLYTFWLISFLEYSHTDYILLWLLLPILESYPRT